MNQRPWKKPGRRLEKKTEATQAKTREKPAYVGAVQNVVLGLLGTLLYFLGMGELAGDDEQADDNEQAELAGDDEQAEVAGVCGLAGDDEQADDNEQAEQAKVFNV